MARKQVQFNLQPVVVHDPDYLYYELLEYRKDISMQRKADAARIEKILSPILCLVHRQKVWLELHSE